jgi:hypothetical protein
VSPERDDIKTLWQSQPMEDMTVSLSDLKSRARASRRRIATRNVVLYAYGLFNIMAGGWLIYAGYFPTMRYPMLLMIVAHFFVLWQVVERVGGRSAPSESAGQSVMSFLRDEFERQRRALANAWAWYILPFMPAFVWELAIWYRAILAHWGSATASSNLRSFEIVVASAIVFWGVVFFLFARGARRWRGELTALERATAE